MPDDADVFRVKTADSSVGTAVILVNEHRAARDGFNGVDAVDVIFVLPGKDTAVKKRAGLKVVEDLPYERAAQMLRVAADQLIVDTLRVDLIERRAQQQDAPGEYRVQDLDHTTAQLCLVRVLGDRLEQLFALTRQHQALRNYLSEVERVGRLAV